MEIAVVLNAHAKPNVVQDTIESINQFMSRKVLVVVDGCSPSLIPPNSIRADLVEGFYHGRAFSPFRNVALGLKLLAENYRADWYCYLEYDCLVASDRFYRNLELADGMGVWMLGNDGHVDEKTIPFMNSLIGEPLNNSYYLLGCCQFFSRNFLKHLLRLMFFDKFLALTNGLDSLPGYDGYDISEHLYPSLARHFGGNIGVFASYDYEKRRWHGSHEVFPLRWRPDLDPATEDYPDASLLHPLKDYDHPIRLRHRERRTNVVSNAQTVGNRLRPDASPPGQPPPGGPGKKIGPGFC